jgi:hypothetical protein
MTSREDERTSAPDEGMKTSGADPVGLRHPMERTTTRVVAALDIVFVLGLLGLLLWGAEWLERVPIVGRYSGDAQVLLVAVFAAPFMVTYARRRRRMLAQEESIRVSATQLPAIHGLLVAHATRAGIRVPELYLSEAIDETTTFTWRDHTCIILSTRELSLHQESFDDVLDFMLAREVGAICLGHASLGNELLASFVGPIPFLRAPLSHMRTYSCDRYGAFLAPRALSALLCEATGERLRNRVDPDAYFTDLERVRRSGFWAWVVPLVRVRLPLAHRVRELRRAGLLTNDNGNPPVTPPIDREARPDVTQNV